MLSLVLIIQGYIVMLIALGVILFASGAYFMYKSYNDTKASDQVSRSEMSTFGDFQKYFYFQVNIHEVFKNMRDQVITNQVAVWRPGWDLTGLLTYKHKKLCYYNVQLCTIWCCLMVPYNYS